jgi:amino acid transporter
MGGAVAALAAYSYLKLGIRYPSVGGASLFLVEEYGDGLRGGALNKLDTASLPLFTESPF